LRKILATENFWSCCISSRENYLYSDGTPPIFSLRNCRATA